MIPNNTEGTLPVKNLSEEEISGIKQAFDCFDSDKSGVLTQKNIKQALEFLEQDCNLTIFRLLKGVSEIQEKVNFQMFLWFLDDHLGDRQSREGIQKVFRFFTDEDTLTSEEMMQIAAELGEDLTVEKIEEALGRAGEAMTFDDFYYIMTRKIYAQFRIK